MTHDPEPDPDHSPDPTRLHYDRLLGPVYAWMVGDLDSATARADAELQGLGLTAGTGLTAGHGALALDLGAGFGLHAVPLARRGYTVIAIDNCRPLLQELRTRARGLPVNVIDGGLLDFPKYLTTPPAVILCMGDTLTHLPDLSAVESLLDAVAAALAPGGTFVTTFRDYATAPLQGAGRFILVRSDEQRMLTCFLEYTADRVHVHDILHEKLAGNWTLKVGIYPKLRLAPDGVAKSMQARGFTVRRETAPGGMVRVVAQRD